MTTGRATVGFNVAGVRFQIDFDTRSVMDVVFKVNA